MSKQIPHQAVKTSAFPANTETFEQLPNRPNISAETVLCKHNCTLLQGRMELLSSCQNDTPFLFIQTKKYVKGFSLIYADYRIHFLVRTLNKFKFIFREV